MLQLGMQLIILEGLPFSVVIPSRLELVAEIVINIKQGHCRSASVSIVNKS